MGCDIIENIEITWNTLLALFAAIAIIGNAITIIKNLIGPTNNWRKKVSAHSKDIEMLKCRVDEQEAAHKVLYRCISTMLDNELSGVEHAKLQEARETLNQFLFDR